MVLLFILSFGKALIASKNFLAFESIFLPVDFHFYFLSIFLSLNAFTKNGNNDRVTNKNSIGAATIL